MSFVGLYGIATFLRGYLIARSGYLPKTIGILLMIAGVGFVAKNVTIVLAPAYSSDYFLAPMSVAGLALMLWILVKGVDPVKWRERAFAARGD
jgi:predicted MFS family arabinose efflux permease